MQTTVTRPPAEVTIWPSRDDSLTPASFAALYRQAAEIIRARGYDPYDEYEGAEGVSISQALTRAATAWLRQHGTRGVIADTQERERLITLDAADTVASWERATVRVYASIKYRSRTQAEATAILGMAAAMLTTIPADGAR
jgi:hypothetical protein